MIIEKRNYKLYNGDCLEVMNDLVGLGVNKAVVLGEGTSVQGKAISLNRLVREYSVVRDLFSNWFKRNIEKLQEKAGAKPVK